MGPRTLPNVAGGSPRALPRVSLLLGVILLVAIALGIAATFLSAPVQPAPPTGPQDRTGSETALVTEGFLGLIVALIILLLIARASGGKSPGVSRYAVSVLMVLTVGVLFVVLLHYLGSGGDLGTASPQNSTGPPPGAPNGTLQPVNNSTGGLFGIPVLPAWAGYAGLVAAALVAVLIAVPLAQARRAERMEAEGLRSVPLRRSFESALTALAPGASADPRAIVIALYAKLLESVAPYLEEVDAATPHEIELECVRRLHLQPANARALTGLFEEARYSSHPFSDAQVERARLALSAALSDLKVPPGGHR
jgi:hypothetical protein